MTREQYRFDQYDCVREYREYDCVHEYRETYSADVFIGKLTGRTHVQFLADYKSDLDYCAYKPADRVFDNTEFDYSQF